jgi:hypothetical protein
MPVSVISSIGVRCVKKMTHLEHLQLFRALDRILAFVHAQLGIDMPDV